ncbi:MAG TPA: DNRLRE domain-containing protein [Planctomycetota bacterium]|jgi:hypothetical protein|nr:DNRLRE domain-containing protein [Planctomycetota bacterium]
MLKFDAIARGTLFAFVALFAVSGLGMAQPLSTAFLNPSKDNTLYEDPLGGLSNALGQGIFAGQTVTNLTRRGLLRFDIASALPAGSKIVSATLQLEMNQTIAGAQLVQLRRVTQDWGEGTSVAGGQGGGGTTATAGDATWVHTFSPSGTWLTPGGDYVPYISASQMVDNLGPYVWGPTFQMTADVQEWLDNPSTNFGWMVIGDESAAPTAKRFVSREGGVVSERPTLAITYTASNIAQAIPTGIGCVPAGGGLSALAFRVGTNEPPTVGSPTFRILGTNGLLNSSISIYLALGLSPVPFNLPGPLACPVYLDPASANLLFAQGLSPIGPLPSSTGDLNLPIPLPNIPSLSGAVLELQLLSFTVTDARTSNALTLRFQ